MIKIKNKILFAVIIFAFSFSIAQAQTFNKATAYVGLNYYHYIEKTAGHDPFMEEKTKLLPSVLIGYKDDTSINSKDKSNGISYFVEGTIGQVEYSQYTGVGTHTHNYWKLQGEALYPVIPNLYVGLGYRHLYDYLSDYGAGGYDRRNELWYLPLGYVLNNSDNSRAKFQFNYLIEGKQNSINYSGGGDIVNKQKNGYGFDISYTPKESSWELFAKYWNIDDSTTNCNRTHCGLEPQNYTYEIGVKFAF